MGMALDEGVQQFVQVLPATRAAHVLLVRRDGGVFPERGLTNRTLPPAPARGIADVMLRTDWSALRAATTVGSLGEQDQRADS
jgi:hypothetical protein